MRVSAHPALIPSLLRWLGNLLMAAGLLVLVLTGAYYGYALSMQQQLAGLELPGPAAELNAAPRVFAPPPGPVDLPSSGPRPDAQNILIPSIGVDSKVVELRTVYDEKGELVWETADHAVGHHVGTANPGEPGNVVMSGHISSPIRRQGNVFNKLPDLKLGAEVYVSTPEGEYMYRVMARRIVEPTEVSVMDPTPAPTVTLITCYPDLIYSHRLIVTAQQESFQAYASD